MRISRVVLTILISFNFLFTVSAQQKDRSIQIYKWRNEPIKILSVKIDDRKVKSKETFVDNDDDWLSGLNVEVENISNKVIVNIQIAIDFPEEPGLKGSPARDYLFYGTSNLSEPNPSQLPLNPRETVTLRVKNYQSLREFLDNVGHSKNLKELRLSIDSILFDDDTKWSAGMVFIRDPDNPDIWLPENKQKSIKKFKFLNSELFKAKKTNSLPFMIPSSPSSGCREIIAGGQYSCPNGCSNSYVISSSQTFPDYTPNTYLFRRRETRCKDSQGQNCDTQTYQNQEYTYHNCEAVAGGDECDFDNCGGFTRPQEDSGEETDSPESVDECCLPSPVLIDISGDGFALTDTAGGVMFDFNGDGIAHQISWTAAETDDAWLVFDRNGNGKIDSSREMFGNMTAQPAIPVGRNGFLALAEYDKAENGGNGDGSINDQDAVFADLRLWQDLNHNGISESSELETLPALNVAEIELDYKTSKKTDEFGNEFRYRAKVWSAKNKFNKSKNKVGRWAWDVFLMLEQPNS